MHLRHFREAMGLTSEELAKLVGVHHVTIKAWERGTNFPRGRELYALCEILNCSCDELIGRKNVADPKKRHGKRLYMAVTHNKKFTSEDIHQIASGFRKLSQGKLSSLELWARTIAEVIYEIDLVERTPRTQKKRSGEDIKQLKIDFTKG